MLHINAFRSHSPDDSADHYGLFPSEDIRNVTGDQSREPGATSHGGSNTTLNIRARTLAWFAALVEVTFVRVSAYDGAHRTDIETKQATANNGHGRDDIDLHFVVNILETK